MTAVAPPPNFQNIARPGWSAPNSSPNGLNSMSADDFRMFMPRKSAQRTNSASSLSSSASSSSTISAASQTNGVGPSPNGEGSTWGTRKKPSRGLWPAAKSEPVAGITNARPQPIAATGPGSSAVSAMSGLHSPAPMLPSQHNATSQQQNGIPRPQSQQDVTAILHLIPMNGTFDRKTITVPFFPDVLRIGRQTNNKTVPTPLNGYFDSKVLSRQHAEIWADKNGKIWIRDVKSSNGTFVNGQRLSPENRDSDPHELREQDMLELGIDIVSEDQKTIVHHKVAARVEHAGIYPNNGNNLLDLNFGELDGPQLVNMLGPSGQPGMGNMRGRTPSQGSMNGARLQGPPGAMVNNMAALSQQRQPNFWLQPITMEQVVKKLNAEIKAARQQSEDLRQASQYINTILTSDPKKEPALKSPTSNVKISPIKDLKNRFTDPPAPPPQQPLPEKPDVSALGLRRADTERPKSTSALGRAEAQYQMSSLTEALASAKKQIETQDIRLRDLEALLHQERRARESAEDRVSQLEREASRETDTAEPAEITIIEAEDAPQFQYGGNEAAVPDIVQVIPGLDDSATARLQQRLEMMMSEMSEMKQQMEQYRQRAENAEAESATHRQTLAEMVEKIRADEANQSARDRKRRSRSREHLMRAIDDIDIEDSDEEDSDEGEITIIREGDMDGEGAGVLLRRVGMQNGGAITPDAPASPKLPHQALTTRPNPNDMVLHAGGPAVSIVGIVLIGMGLMAWLNNYSKVER